MLGICLHLRVGRICARQARRSVLGRFDDAESHFAAALAANEKIRAVIWLAHTQCGLASLLLARGEGDDRERARALIAGAANGGRSGVGSA